MARPKTKAKVVKARAKTATAASAARELRKRCGFPEPYCRAAIRKHGDDVDGVLAILIAAGEVYGFNLNPQLVSDDMFLYAKQWELKRDIALHDGILAAYPPDSAEHRALKVKRQAIVDELKRLTPANGRRLREQRLRMAGIERRSRSIQRKAFHLKLPPFPPLKLDMHEWTGQDRLPAWKGTQSRRGEYTSRSSRRPSDGTVDIEIPRAEGDEDDENPTPPYPEQVAAYKHLKEHDHEIAQKVLEALLKDFRKMVKEGYFPEDDDEVPQIETVEEMRRHVGLGTLHVLDLAKAGHAYLGLELGCTWEEEHGAGVLLHKSRVVAVGQADVSFDSHAATRDGGKPLGSKKRTRKS